MRGIRIKILSQYALCVIARHFNELGYKIGPLALYHHRNTCGKRVGAAREIVTYLLGSPVVLANILALLQEGQDLLDRGLLFLPLPHLKTLTTLAGLLLLVLERLLDELDILEPQLLTDDVKITGRVDVTLDVDNLGIVETPHNLEDGIDSADVRQEGIAETGTC